MSKQAWLATILWRSPRLRARLLRWRLALARLNRRGAVALSGMALAVALGVGSPAPGAGPPRTDDMIVVNGEVAVNDNGLCSLIEAIHNSNDTTTGLVYADCAAGNPDGPDRIILPDEGDFTLIAADNTTYGPSGLPIFTDFVTIESSTRATIHRDPAAEPFRVLAVGREGLLILEQVTLSGGEAEPMPERAAEVTYANVGGGALNLGHLSLHDTIISGNTAYAGGGVYNAGNLYGGVEFRANHAGLGGGDALLSFGKAHLLNTPRFVDNGDAYFSVTVQNEGEMLLLNAQFEDNPSSVSIDNRADLTVRDSQFSGAHAAIDNKGDVTVEGTIISGNGTGMSNRATALIDRSAIIGNKWGLVNSAGEMTLVNSTISGNHNGYEGGGVAVYGGRVRGLFNTLSDNSAGRGGGVFVSGHYSMYTECFAGWMSLQYSILSGNAADAGPEAYVEQASPLCLGHLYLDGSIVGHDGQSGTIRAIIDDATVADVPLAAILDPALSTDVPLSPVHRLPWGSPAVDALEESLCSLADNVDQRGQPRNQDGDGQPTESECDAGAFERSPLSQWVFAPVVGATGGEP